MRPEIFALLTGIFWAIGSFFGKKGLGLANLEPKIGLVIRLVVSLIVVGLIAGSELTQLREAFQSPAGRRGLLYLLIFEGVVAGSLGMIFYYNAIKTGQLSRVMPLAFATPLWGFILAVIFAGEQVTTIKATGAGMAITGILILAAT